MDIINVRLLVQNEDMYEEETVELLTFILSKSLGDTLPETIGKTFKHNNKEYTVINLKICGNYQTLILYKL